jgi:elongation factor Ts
MAEISATAVKNLRDRTNAPMMECKSALSEAHGDMDKAVEIIRKKIKDATDKRATRETAEGRIAIFADPAAKVGAIVEMRCESPPVSKNELFVKLAEDVARQVALKGPGSVEELLSQPFIGEANKTVQQRIGDAIGLIRENMRLARFKRLTGATGGYVHHDGSVGVLLTVEGAVGDPQVLRDVAMHITAKNPSVLRREDIAADVLAKEKEIARAQLQADPKNKNKPANIVEMIIEGKLKAWFAENVLLEQPFVKDDTKTVGDLLKSHKLTLVSFVRMRVGEL